MAPATMFKLLSQTTVTEDSTATSPVSTLRNIGNAFASGYNATKGKINAQKEKEAAEAEKEQSRAEKQKEADDKKRAEEAAKLSKNELIQDVVQSIFAYLPTPPLQDPELLDKDGNIKDPAWHQLSAEELQFINKYTKRVEKTFSQFRSELEKRLKSASFLTKPQRDEALVSLQARPKEVDTRTHTTLNTEMADSIISMLKSSNLKYGLDAVMAKIKEYADAIDKTPALDSGPGKKKAPLAVDRGIFMVGAMLNNYQEHIANVLAAIEGHEFETVLNPAQAASKAKEQDGAKTASASTPVSSPVKETRRLVGFRPLTEGEA